MKLLMIIPLLETGGAEWAFVRQANALVEAGCGVTCYVPYLNLSAEALVNAFDPRVNVVRLTWINHFRYRVLFKLSQVLPGNMEQKAHSFILRGLQRRESFDAVNPHLNSGTTIACLAFKNTKVPVVETDHGDYALILKQDPSMSRLSLPFQRVDAMICPSKANLDRIARLPWQDHFRSTVVPNCYPISAQPVPRAMPEEDVFTFGMVSRGVPEKGWREAITAYRMIRERTDKPTRLVLVGGGEHLSALARDLVEPLREHVFFAGQQPDPRPWIESFDVALLPSYFTAESLPNVIVESLAQHKPVIATRVGGIADMLDSPDQTCGLLIPITGSPPRADVNALADAMMRLLNDEALRRDYAEAATRAVARYQPSVCARAIMSFVETVKSTFVSTTKPHTKSSSLLIEP